MSEILAPEELLKQEIAGLSVSEILALCYSFPHRMDRLRLYLDVLRKRGGHRAQFAACLMCFDLARQGDESMQQDFVFLAGAIRDLAGDQTFVDEMLDEDPYLTFIWELLAAQLEEMDSRFDTEHTLQTTHPSGGEIAALDLISDDDFAEELDLDLDFDEPALREAFDQAVERFLGKIPDYPAYDPNAGFRIGHRGDTDRVERFLLDLESLREPIAAARAYRAITMLFYATNMRSKSLFGAINERKQSLLREGLREFIESGDRVWELIGVMDLHGERRAWSKIAEVITDYAHWLAMHPDGARLEDYDAVERQVERDRRRGPLRKSRR